MDSSVRAPEDADGDVSNDSSDGGEYLREHREDEKFVMDAELEQLQFSDGWIQKRKRRHKM